MKHETTVSTHSPADHMKTKNRINYRLLFLDLSYLLATGFFYNDYLTWDYNIKGMYIPLGFFGVSLLYFFILLYWLIRRNALFFGKEMRLTTWILLVLYILTLLLNVKLIRIGLG